jgi:hypothetical protein
MYVYLNLRLKDNEMTHSNRVKTLVSGILVAAVLMLAVAAWATAEENGTPSPHPRYAPDEIVRIQLEALQRNDIEATFRFASPANRMQTGPLERFTRLFDNPVYSPMLGSLTIQYYRLEMSQNYARQRVQLIGKNGEEVVYVFYLSKQSDAPYQDCWMTDAVRVESWSKPGQTI